MKKIFDLKSQYKPAGDQGQAIDQILDVYKSGGDKVTLLGATGTGKTFTMANVIDKINKPTLIISHNKTLAAQLATEFKQFFPNNAVHYFVSYFDYYQPESYLPHKDVYIEKEATVNKEIEMYRLSTMASLLTREDVIVVSSVSALYGLGAKEFFANSTIHLKIGDKYNHKELKSKLIKIQYKPVSQKFESGMFDMRGEMLDIYSSTEKYIYRFFWNEDKLEMIEKRDPITRESHGTVDHVVIWPSTQYLQDQRDLENILIRIEAEMQERVAELERLGKPLEANRLQKRTMYDIRMIKETGFTNGIENYSMYFEDREWGETPNTIFDYFPDDMLIIMDESHMSVPQLRSMPNADATRKFSLIEHGFRLPSAAEHRPLAFEELKLMLNWNKSGDSKPENISDIHINKSDTKEANNIPNKKIKKACKSMFVSATPADYELEISDDIAQQVIRPTGLLDPITYIYPKSGDYKFLLENIHKTLDKKPYLTKFLGGYESVSVEDIFEDIEIDEIENGQ